MTKLVALYRHRKTLLNELVDLAQQPTDATDIPGAEFRLHMAHVCVTLDGWLSNSFKSMSSKEQHDVIKMGL